MTCRIAAREYTFEKFTEVEIADFDEQQITTFANNWFKDKPVKPQTFLTQILHLICKLFVLLGKGLKVKGKRVRN